jgi:hypothetical protein
MSDLFEFIAAQQMGRAAEEARRAAEEAQRPAKVRSIIDKMKGKHKLGEHRKLGNSRLDGRLRSKSRPHTISPVSARISRCGGVLFCDFGPMSPVETQIY